MITKFDDMSNLFLWKIIIINTIKCLKYKN